jgi:hypothetical protein
MIGGKPMLDRAIAKIKAEVENNANDDFIPTIGEFIIHHLNTNPEHAENILAEGKTIEESVKDLWKEASKKQKDKRASMSPQQWMTIVLKHFDIDSEQELIQPQTTSIATAVPLSSRASSGDFEVNLDDLL